MPDEIDFDVASMLDSIKDSLGDPLQQEWILLEHKERMLTMMMYFTTIFMGIGISGYFLDEMFLQVASMLGGVWRLTMDMKEYNNLIEIRRMLTIQEVMGK